MQSHRAPIIPSKPSDPRGGVYVLCLGAAAMLSVIGLAVLVSANLGAKANRDARDFDEAGALAQAAVDQALATINNDPNWRANELCNEWAANRVAGGGGMSYKIKDEVDDDIAAGEADPIRIHGRATVGATTRFYSVAAQPVGGTGIDALRCTVHSLAGVGVSGSDPVNAIAGPLSTNATLNNAVSLSADVEALAVVNTGTINGAVTTPAPAKPLPGNSLFTAFEDRAVQIAWSSLSSGKIENCVLSADSNPFGAESAAGIYLIQVPLLSTLTIRNCRIAATLVVVVNSSASLRVENSVIWDPPSPELPSLLVSGPLLSSVQFQGTRTVLQEAKVGVNLNPGGLPYDGASDSDMTDEYSSLLRGVFHVFGSLCSVTVENARFRGVLLAEGSVGIQGQSVFTLDPSLYTDPPTGYAGIGAVMRPVLGTWRWETALSSLAAGDAPPPIVDIDLHIVNNPLNVGVTVGGGGGK